MLAVVHGSAIYQALLRMVVSFADNRASVALQQCLGRLTRLDGLLAAMLVIMGTMPAMAVESTTFRFESLVSLDEMRDYLARRFPVGSHRTAMRQVFVEQGKATLFLHPSQSGIEKYVYDIDLCGYYVWRWNISGNFDAGDHLVQTYVNGEPLFPSQVQKKDADVLAKSGKASIFRMTRDRPEAYKGERKLTFLVLDADSNLQTVDDQVLTGSGPSRADPLDMGQVHEYVNVEPWRSIFDFDQAGHIAHYDGNCSKADELMGTHKRIGP